MFSKNQVFKSDFATVKQYGNQFKLTYFKRLTRLSGFEEINPAKLERTNVLADDACKFDSSLSRARATVFELAACNDWDFFVTLTLDETKINRFDLKNYISKFSQFVRNFNRLHGGNVEYLLIPERHKDQAWHMHGLMRGFPADTLVRNEYNYLSWLGYARRFGFISLAPVRNPIAVAKYITKYVTKTMLGDAERRKEIGAHLYYSSQGLNKAVLVARGTLSCAQFKAMDFDYSNEYVAVKWGVAGDFILDVD